VESALAGSEWGLVTPAAAQPGEPGTPPARVLN
jgi:hypothetical protein